MGIDVFVACYRNGEMASFPRRIVEEIFGKYINNKEDDCWSPEFSDGGGCNVFITAEPQIGHFMVGHAVASPELWDCLFQALVRTGSFLILPSGQVVVADPSVMDHLEKGFLKPHEAAIVVKGGEEIRDAID